MENFKVQNAIIESVSLDTGDRDLLTCWLHLNYGGSGQGFGGHALYLPKSYKHATITGDYAGHFLYRCMQVAGVTEWSKIVGKSIRVKHTMSGIHAIGHITKEDWFCPSEDFKAMSPNHSQENL